MNKDYIMKTVKSALRFLPDEAYVKLYFRLRMHRKLDLNNPVYFNDKLQWLKFNYRLPLQTVVSDKYEVRKYVANLIGEEYLVPLLGVWDEFDEIDFEKLPERFVLKCNHDSGGLVVCRDKSNLNIAHAKKKIEKCLKQNFFIIGREYQYKNIIPKILCEEFISENGEIPTDYKIFCFDGEPDVVLACTNRFSMNSNKAQYGFFDLNWNYLAWDRGDDKACPMKINKPENLERMLEIARILSKDFLFARIDLYNIKGKIYFGEITLSPNSGFDGDILPETDKYFGDKLQIPYWNQLKH
ncbi:MAG: ATP-grasp fold amidoligase family protein [Candidatus Limivicinus sp.]